MTHRPRAEPVGFDAYRLSPSQRRLLPWVVAFSIAVGLAVWAAAAAMADEVQLQQQRPFCDEPPAAAKALKDTFGELPAAIGVDTNDRLVSFFVDPDDGSWTVLLTVPGQHPISCVLTGGEGWQPMLMLKGDPA